ncbi:MAG: hypothetical protein D6811_01905 [Alphaproteobacteria bacterium]|nr:MAG: hypothetical protein D6811_01905 [Alphaproteobacteria bacterium]
MWGVVWLFVVALLAGCAGPVRDGVDAVARAAYRAPGPPSVTLITVVRNDYRVGTHSALLINGSQRVLYDPAGSWKNGRAPERDDLRFGIDDEVLAHFLTYHARRGHSVVLQEVPVAPEVAEAAIRAAAIQGAARPGFCADSVARVLRRVPGWQELRVTFFPTVLMGRFQKLTDARVRMLVEEAPAPARGSVAVGGAAAAGGERPAAS